MSESAQEKGTPPNPAKPHIHTPHKPQQARPKGPPPLLRPPPRGGPAVRPTLPARQARQSHAPEASEASAELTPSSAPPSPAADSTRPKGASKRPASLQRCASTERAPRGISVSVLRDVSQQAEGYQSDLRGIALSRPRQSCHLPRGHKRPRVPSATGSMLSGIYYIHEGGAQSKEPPPNTHKDQATSTRTSLLFPAPTQAQHGAKKRLHEGNKTQDKG